MQTTLTTRLPEALKGIPFEDEVSLHGYQLPHDHSLTTLVLQIIDQIRHSVEALRHLAPEAQLRARLVYYDALRYAFAASTGVACLGILAALVASGSGLRKTHK